MTISSTTNRVAYLGAGSVGPYAYTFRVFAAADLIVTVRDDDDVETTLAYLTDYTVTGVGNASGTITLTTALAVGETLTIRRSPSLLQSTNFEDAGSFFARDHQTALDRAVAQIQAVDDVARRSIGVTESYAPGDMSLRVKPETGKVLAWQSASELGNSTLDSSAIAIPGGGRTVATASAYLLNNAVFNVKDWGAAGDDATDDTIAIAACIAAAKAAGKPCEVIIPAGTYVVTSTITFDLPDYSTIRFIGSIRCQTAGATVVRIGPAAGSTNALGYTVLGLDVYRNSSIDLTGSVGIELRNLAFATIYIRRCMRFTKGVRCYGAGTGFTYNEIHLGFLHDSTYNLRLDVDGSAGGYCNENNFYGGSYNHTSDWNPLVASWNLYVSYGAVNPLNNNRFYGPSLEDDGVLAVAAFLDGENVLILHPRMERNTSPTTYEIQFGAHSLHCEVIGIGAGVGARTNFSDVGSCNSFRWNGGEKRAFNTSADATPAWGVTGTTSEGKDGRQLTSIVGSSRVQSIRDNGGALRGWDTNEGFLARLKGYFKEGIRWETGSGSYDDRGIFLRNNATPEGSLSADPGSLAIDYNNGEMYRKVSSGGNTGWRVTPAVHFTTATPEASVTARPGAIAIDTTNHKVYFKETGTGNTGWLVVN